MRYSHLITFLQPGGKYMMKTLTTDGLLPKIDEWNSFCRTLFGETVDWIVINIVTIKL